MWDGPIDSRIVNELLRRGLTPRWISLRMASRQLEVDQRTLNLIMRRGLIRYKIEKTDKSCRILLRSDDIKPEWFSPTPLLNDRMAAEYLGIPVSVLKGLRQSGEYEQTYFGAYAIRFATRDIDALKKLVVSGKHYTQANPIHGVRLGDVMRMKFGSRAVKANIVRAIITGEIRTVASNPNTLASLILHPDDLKMVLACFELASMNV